MNAPQRFIATDDDIDDCPQVYGGDEEPCRCDVDLAVEVKGGVEVCFHCGRRAKP